MCNCSYGFEIYLVNIKTRRTIVQIFVAFSEKLNFNDMLSSSSCHAVVRQLSGSRQAVVRKSSGSRLAVTRQLSGSHERVSKKRTS